MLDKKHQRLLSLFIGSSGYLVPRPSNEYVKLSKTMHPFLLGKRNIHYFYDLEKSLYGIRATMEVLKNIVANEGRVLFVSDSPLLQPRFAKSANLNSIKWKRGYLAKSRYADLVFLTGVGKENLVEAHRKSMLVVGVGSSTMSNTAYPFNLNIDSPLLSDWFFGALYAACVQGSRLSEKKKKEAMPRLLGRGRRIKR